MKNVNKNYGGVHALKDVDFSLKKNEIHCLVGENGSGKSTLIKIISGVVHPESGTKITIKGKSFKALTPIRSVDEGIQVIYQDLSLFPNLSVAENICITEYQKSKANFVNYTKMRKKATHAMEKIDVNIDPDKLVRELSIAQKQIVAIVRAIATDAELIIMDEPTASLSKHEIDELLNLIKKLQKKGLTILFVSHKLDEIMRISERVTVLRDGEKIGTYDASEMNDNKLTYLMTGKEFSWTKKNKREEAGKKILEINNLCKTKNYKDINFDLYEGEILGIIGLIGSGRTELALSIFGMNPPDSGEIILEGKKMEFKSNYDAIKAGISYLPEDRLNEGLILQQSIGSNIVVPILDRIINNFGVLKEDLKNEIVEKWVENINIKTQDPDNPAKTLSGGNQQKVVVAKWLATEPRVLILDSPTVGVDVAAKHGIYEIMKELASKKLGIILISDEVPEIYSNANRILIMKKGRILKETCPEETNEEELRDMIIAGEINV
ncbi:MAG: sugar ABC transporter ATP-binding protein [Kosmotoga sp.]|jgi:simple sugar transport system ATP-binding protein|nr:MAG: sugar ABC transporter ATP-binding protein [Kosmotoga sp.]